MTSAKNACPSSLFALLLSMNWSKSLMEVCVGEPGCLFFCFFSSRVFMLPQVIFRNHLTQLKIMLFISPVHTCLGITKAASSCTLMRKPVLPVCSPVLYSQLYGILRSVECNKKGYTLHLYEWNTNVSSF